ncbi:UbiD family decarboxylase domain-containing protein [Haloarcula sp. Atlit-7R]|uniref:UbiD family decarboxylase domain-containing protein n=1 Tax=Haloarcula sp. Atlit-7R TaxID=2282125 RepID=UPI000EF138BB|nr:UbiD family decarboxylase domain-containing protein [Haloarcula sp. Atlit-7R]RLM94909.1 prenyl carboxy-lyase [Haloarcula sp. Atlit-7R]
MIPFTQYVRGLAGDDDLVRLDGPFEIPVDALAAEALRASGPALRFQRSTGIDLVSGVFSGPDQTQHREARPWSRLSLGLGLDPEAALVDLLETIGDLGPAGENPEPTYTGQAASGTDIDGQDLQFPQGETETWPTVTLGVASISTADGTHWAPVHGSVVGGDTLRVRVPDALSSLVADGATMTIALGVPPAAIAMAYLLAVTEQTATPIQSCGVTGTVPLVPTNGGLVPSATEVVIETTVADRQPDFRSDRREGWEYVVASGPLSLSVESVRATESPVIPISPVGCPLADDSQLTGLVTAATLYHRVNNYWGISPVEWVMLPAEAELGICFVASDILYGGFEWQLANILFSFSSLFDTVVIVDEDVPPQDFGRVLADVWLKSHPARDWTFSESDAPAATRPHYRQNNETGSRLYVNAAWDPRWKETYIAPRVTFENSFPSSVRDVARVLWDDSDIASGVRTENESSH